MFFHGWDGALRNHMSGALWARANAWITLATPIILKELPIDSKNRAYILNSLREQIAALAEFQRADGSFGTLLDFEHSYSDTSAAVGFSAGIKMAYEMGLIDESYLQTANKAYHYVVSKIDKKGNVTGVSTGTPIMETKEDYLNISVSQTLYGQGLALFMLCS